MGAGAVLVPWAPAPHVVTVVLLAVVAWFALSVPVALVLGRVLRGSDAAALSRPEGPQVIASATPSSRCPHETRIPTTPRGCDARPAPRRSPPPARTARGTRPHRRHTEQRSGGSS
jgi:hypothetical protein